jgi:hypothetical protein
MMQCPECSRFQWLGRVCQDCRERSEQRRAREYMGHQRRDQDYSASSPISDMLILSMLTQPLESPERSQTHHVSTPDPDPSPSYTPSYDSGSSSSDSSWSSDSCSSSSDNGSSFDSGGSCGGGDL